MQPGAYEFAVMPYWPSSNANPIRNYGQGRGEVVLTYALGETLDGALASAIQSIQRKCLLCCMGTRANDSPPAALFDHLFCCILVTQEGTTRIDDHDTVPIIDRGCGTSLPKCKTAKRVGRQPTGEEWRQKGDASIRYHLRPL